MTDRHRLIDPVGTVVNYWRGFEQDALNSFRTKLELLAEFARLMRLELSPEAYTLGCAAVEMSEDELDAYLFNRVDWSDPESVAWFDAVRVLRWMIIQPPSWSDPHRHERERPPFEVQFILFHARDNLRHTLRRR